MNTFTSPSSANKLVLSQGLNAFGDHLVKIVASSLVAATFSEHQASVLVGVISFLYIAPYVLFAPVVGMLTQRFSKRSIVQLSLLGQVFAMATISISASLQSFGGIFVGLCLVAVQSCFLAPARNALLKEYAGIQKIGQKMGLLALVGVGGTLAGLAVGGWAFDSLWERLDNIWMATSVIGVISAALALVAFIVVMSLEKGNSILETRGESFVSVFKELIRRPAMRWSSLGLAWFYGVGSMLVMLLLQDGRWDHGQEIGAASQGGLMAALLGVGVALGSGLAALGCRKQVEVGWSFLGALGIMVFAPLTALFWDSNLASSIGVVLVGVSGGLFSAPLNALFLTLARDEARANSLAANNLVINVVTAGFIGLGSLLAYLGWSPAAQLTLVGASSVVVVFWMSYLVPESLLRLILLAIARAVYPVRCRGLSNIPSEGGALIVANHVSYADALLIYANSNRPVRFVGTDQMLKFPWMRWVYRRFNVIAVSPTRAKDAVSKTVSALKDGSVVCIFPEGALTRTGMIMPFKKGAELIARMSKCPVVPASIDGMWGSVFSFAEKPFRYRAGMPLRRQVAIRFGEAVPFAEATASRMQDAVMKLGYETFSDRPGLKSGLGVSVLKSLSKNPFETRCIDKGIGGKKLNGAALASMSLEFSRIIRKETKARRVGLLLPPGLFGFSANIACLWAGVSSVNLNPTVSSDSFRSMIEESDLDTVFTSKTLLKRFGSLPLEGVKLVCIEDLVSRFRGVRSVADALIVAVMPVCFVQRLFSISKAAGDHEATVLFSSGSSANPKGIVLSHKNLTANVTQLSECFLMKSGDSILANLPLFHSFGLTGGLYLPLLKGMKIVATPSPLQVKENINAICTEKIDVVLGTPTFLRSYLSKATPEDFASLRLTIAGAEKLSDSLREQWKARFGSPILEGYGLTECSPVLAANCLHSFELTIKGAIQQSGYRDGTVGRPLPGVWLRIVSESDPSRVLERGESGLIVVKGPNVFRGYLDSSLNRERFLDEGWMNTGDIGRIDSDGYLKVEGRLSRFSKIGGEMVSHQSVEHAIERAFPELQDENGPAVFISSRTCERKGEVLVALSRVSIECGEIGRRLRALGVPNLWIPQLVLQVEEIPSLGTGKIDLKRCAELCAA